MSTILFHHSALVSELGLHNSLRKRLEQTLTFTGHLRAENRTGTSPRPQAARVLQGHFAARHRSADVQQTA